MAQEIAKLPKSNVLNIEEDEYIDYLESKFSLAPIKVNIFHKEQTPQNAF